MKTTQIVFGASVVLSWSFLAAMFLVGFGHLGVNANLPTSGVLAASAVSSGENHSNALSISEIAKHNSSNDCWMVVGGKVYDVTSYLPNHPGGPATMVPYCGKNATSAFAGLPHSQTAQGLLASYYLGDVGASSNIAPPQSPPSVPVAGAPVSLAPFNSTVPSSQPSASSFSLVQVASHSSQSDCWMIVSGKVYDVTSYIPYHPGGPATIVPYCGKDGTAAFTGLPHSQNAVTLLASYYKGVLDSAPVPPPAPAPPPSVPSLSVSASPSVVTVGMQASVTFSVTSSGVPVGGVLVSLVGVASGSGTTDANGVVAIGVNAASAGSVTVTASKAGYTGGSVSLIAVSPPPPTSAAYTLAQISLHNSQSDCWLIVNSNVYDVTSYIPFHPGGPATIVPYCGKDATAAFTGLPHSQNAATLLASYFIGVVDTTVPVLSLSVSAVPASVTVGNLSSVTFSVTSSGVPVSGALVSLGGSAAGSGTTDSTGMVAIVVNAASAGTITATASKSGYSNGVTTLTSVYLPPPSNGSLSVSASSATVTVGAATPVVFTVTSSGVPVGGVLVVLNGSASGSGTTDVNGAVSIGVNASVVGSITAAASKANYTSGVVTLTSTAGTPAYTLAQVALHNSQGSCWMIVSGNVYDVTSYLPIHPGGVGAILPYCGADGTAAFVGLPHSQTATSLLASYFIGVVGTSPPVSNLSLSVSASPVSVTVGTQTSVNFTVTSNGSAVSSALVSLTGSASGSGTTSGTGLVTINVNASVAGSITATASKANYTNGSVVLVAVSPVSNLSLSVSASPLSVNVGNRTSVTFNVTSAGAPVGGAVVSLSGGVGNRGTTSSNGVVVIRVNASVAGSITATASKANYTNGSVVLVAVSPVSNLSLSVSASPASVTVGNLTSVTFSVTSSGVPVGGVLVVLNGSASGSGTTDVNGAVSIGVNASVVGSITAAASKANYTSGVVTLTSTAGTPAYTLAQVALHNSQGSCWMIVSGNVYDVTSYLPIHPGGVGAILPYCGADGTAAFVGLPHSQTATSLLASYLIGVVA